MVKNKKTDWSRNFGIPYYLHIHGSSGHGENWHGGKYNFVGGYFHPTQLEGLGSKSLDIWCEQKSLNYVTADTMDELLVKIEDLEPTYI